MHIGSRVAAAASAREVLVSRTVKDLVAGSGIVFEDRGERELKGVPGTWAALRRARLSSPSLGRRRLATRCRLLERRYHPSREIPSPT